MSRETRLNRTVRRAIERRLEKEKHKESRPHRRLLGFVLFAVGIPGIIAGVLALLPRASISSSEPLNESDPFSAPFVVANDGVFDLNDVKFTCIPIKVVTSTMNDSNLAVIIDGGSIRNDPTAGIRATNLDVGILRSDSRTTAACAYSSAIHSGAIKEASIRIILSFRQAWLPYRRSIAGDFILTKDNSGHFHWLHGSFPN
jgi:hypothetical protein